MTGRLELTADGRTVHLSSPEKLLVEGVTKHDVAAHWLAVGPLTLAAVGHRLVSAKRAPDGPGGETFFQKNAPRGMPSWVLTAAVPRRSVDETVNHVVLEDTAHLLALTQFGTVEVHVTTWDVHAPFQPRELVLDLDPPADAPVEQVRTALLATTDLLADLGLPWRVKTTGSKGFHVHVPLADFDLDLARDAAATLADALVERHPELLTTEFRKDARTGRVLVDWWRNTGGATAIAAWSPRIAPGGPVARPLHRHELTSALPDALLLADVPAHLDAVGDPWAEPLAPLDRAGLLAALSRLGSG